MTSKEEKELKDMVKDLELRVQVLEYDRRDMAYSQPVCFETETYTDYPYCKD